MGNWTPGPWHVPPKQSGEGWWVKSPTETVAVLSREADAKLCAAAPALVAALETLVAESDQMLEWLFERYRWNTVAESENSVKYQALLHTTKQARAALALVEGEK